MSLQFNDLKLHELKESKPVEIEIAGDTHLLLAERETPYLDGEGDQTYRWTILRYLLVQAGTREELLKGKLNIFESPDFHHIETTSEIERIRRGHRYRKVSGYNFGEKLLK